MKLIISRCLKRKSLLLLLLSTLSFCVCAQIADKDTVLKKRSAVFLYEHASEVLLGKVTLLEKKENGLSFKIKSLQNLKGNSQYITIIQALPANQPFFKKDSLYYLFTFRKYTSEGSFLSFFIGSPLQWQESKIISQSLCHSKVEEECSCVREFFEVCGCDGKLYVNPCKAICAGITIYTPGPCYKAEQ